jgi:hypothetical protein
MLGLVLTLIPPAASAVTVSFLDDHTNIVTVTTDPPGVGIKIDGTGEFAMWTHQFSHAPRIPFAPTQASVDLMEATMATAISDIVEIRLVDGVLTTNIEIRFISESDGGPPLQETNLMKVARDETCDCAQDLTTAFKGIGTIGGQLPGDFHIIAQSDCDSLCRVPQPSTMSLLAIGILCVVGTSRRVTQALRSRTYYRLRYR